MQQAAPTTTANNSAFATLQNNTDSNSNSNSNPSSNSRWNKECVCGSKHRFSDCYYIVEQKRPRGWKPNADIQKEVDEKISSTPWIKRIVKLIQKREQEAKNTESTIDFDSKTSASKTPTINAAVFSTGQIPFELQNTWILDPGADTHVCNNEEDDYLIAGGNFKKI